MENQFKITSSGSFNGIFNNTFAVGDTINTEFGVVTIAEILHHHSYLAQNKQMVNYYEVAVSGELKMPKQVAALVWDLYPSLGDTPPDED